MGPEEERKEKEANDKAQYDLEQERLMSEECILVNEKDEVVGHASKRVCHQVSNIKKGMLHRAFSVFLFNSEGKLLLQKRSSKKITFPSCWTNTCCSHPLYVQSEMATQDNIGVKRAARRKLEHELGIPQDSIELDDFKFITKIKYVALHDQDWGEHEVDYVLLLRMDNVDLSKVNDNEIDECKWVDLDQVGEICAQATAGKLLISPWFHLIKKRFLDRWWADLDGVFQQVDREEQAKIHHLE